MAAAAPGGTLAFTMGLAARSSFAVVGRARPDLAAADLSHLTHCLLGPTPWNGLQ